MSDLRANTIFGAVLGAALGVMGLGVLSEALFAPQGHSTTGYLPEVAEGGSSGAAPAAPAGPPDFGTLFADPAGLAALVTRGERVHNQCTSCHSFEAGGANGTGPNLHDVLGRRAGSHAGFSFSPALVAYGQVWSYENMDEWLRSPSGMVRGNRMAFAGIRNEQDRVALIAYLRSISPNPPALPAPRPAAAPAAEGEAAPAEGAAPAAPAPPG